MSCPTSCARPSLGPFDEILVQIDSSSRSFEMADRVYGPASYFPSIEAKYGRSIAEWKALMRASGLTSHRQLVEWLKKEHGFGHGHANAITAHLLAEGSVPQITE